jgi:hypothetical protein
MRKIATIALAAFAVAALAFAPGAAAKRHSRCATSARVDRNHDRLPDRWECRHHLSLGIKQARRDQDRDHLNNLGEFREGTNPRDADTDNDGIEDGDEHELGDDPTDDDSDNDGAEDGNESAGKVESFDGTTLTIRRTDNSLLTGQVTNGTEIECETADEHENDDNLTARSSENSGPGDDEAEHEGDENSGPGNVNEPNGDNNDEDQGDDDQGDDDERACSTADLQPGTPVHEAEVENGVFREVELVK